MAALSRPRCLRELRTLEGKRPYLVDLRETAVLSRPRCLRELRTLEGKRPYLCGQNFYKTRLTVAIVAKLEMP